MATKFSGFSIKLYSKIEYDECSIGQLYNFNEFKDRIEFEAVFSESNSKIVRGWIGDLILNVEDNNGNIVVNKKVSDVLCTQAMLSMEVDSVPTCKYVFLKD